MSAQLPLWIYCIGSMQSMDRVKIGRSYWPKGRLRELSNCAPYPLLIWGQWVAPWRGYETHKAEWFVHRHYIDRRIHGEWFRVSPRTVCDEIPGLLEAFKSVPIDGVRECKPMRGRAA
jgi:hypothetical protein